MSARRYVGGLILAWCGLLAAVPALSQTAPAGAAAKADPQVAARYQIAVMEGILEAAVQHGARVMSRQWRTVAPEMLLISGNARVRGFRLDSYGMFFDVDVPAMRQSVMWTWRMLDRDGGGAELALQSLKNHIKTVTDPAQRRDLDQAIRRLELQVAPFSKVIEPPGAAPETSGREVQATAVAAVPVTAASARQAQPAAPGVADDTRMMSDPNSAYTSAVKEALVDAILDHSQALAIGPDEWVTVAARDNEPRSLPGDEPFEVVTILIRIKGSDLLALHGGRLSRGEARARVEVREY